MNRNQKIALGCGGAGCLGLIVVAIAGGLIYYFAINQSFTRGYNYNVSTNRNSNSNDNSDTLNSNGNSSNSSSTSVASISDDDKHKLYQAAIMTADAELLRRVEVKLGLMKDDYTHGDDYENFVAEHVSWVIRNTGFVQSIGSAQKARTYVNENFPE